MMNNLLQITTENNFIPFPKKHSLPALRDLVFTIILLFRDSVTDEQTGIERFNNIPRTMQGAKSRDRIQIYAICLQSQSLNRLLSWL